MFYPLCNPGGPRGLPQTVDAEWMRVRNRRGAGGIKGDSLLE